MKKILFKIKSKAGESLIESLVAILIFTLASIAMFTMVSVASNINLEAKQADRINQEQLLIAEQGEGASAAGTVTMTLDRGAGKDPINVIVADVDIYGTEGGLYAYYKHNWEGD